MKKKRLTSEAHNKVLAKTEHTFTILLLWYYIENKHIFTKCLSVGGSWASVIHTSLQNVRPSWFIGAQLPFKYIRRFSLQWTVAVLVQLQIFLVVLKLKWKTTCLSCSHQCHSDYYRVENHSKWVDNAVNQLPCRGWFLLRRPALSNHCSSELHWSVLE